MTDNDFEELLPLCSKQTKNAKTEAEEQAVFKLFSRGNCTGRDAWVYDFDKENLAQKINFFISVYDKTRADENYKDKFSIKWERELDKYRVRNINKFFEYERIIPSLFRPFIKKQLYFDRHFNQMIYQNPAIFGKYGELENKVIHFQGIGWKTNFYCVASDTLTDIQNVGNGQCLPLYRYDAQGARLANITDWGLAQFQNHYKNTAITKEVIFGYTYAVLHCPVYRKKYVHDLKREFPRIPFYQDFWHWSKLGAKLLDLHINYESARPFPLKRRDLELDYIPRPKLKADKNLGHIQIDEQTILSGIPPTAWLYKLGNRSALEWVLDQYKEKKIKDATVAAKFNTYKFSAYKAEVISLLQRVCQVSLETVALLKLK